MCCSCGGKWVNLSLFKAIRHSPMPTHSWYSADTYGSPPWYKMMFHGHHPKDSFLMVCPCAWPRHNKVMHGAELVFCLFPAWGYSCTKVCLLAALCLGSLQGAMLQPCSISAGSWAAERPGQQWVRLRACHAVMLLAVMLPSLMAKLHLMPWV